jgi:hypothetical protein
VRLAIDRSLALQGETVHRKLFELARRLASAKGFDARQITKIAHTWFDEGQQPKHSRNRAQIPRQLRTALARVTTPKGSEFDKLVQRARKMTCPAWMPESYHGKPELLLLVKLCVVLEEHAAGKAWPLSVRKAQEAVDTSRGDAMRMLTRIAQDGVIVCVERGTLGTLSRKATTWRLGSVASKIGTHAIRIP